MTDKSTKFCKEKLHELVVNHQEMIDYVIDYNATHDYKQLDPVFDVIRKLIKIEVKAITGSLKFEVLPEREATLDIEDGEQLQTTIPEQAGLVGDIKINGSISLALYHRFISKPFYQHCGRFNDLSK